MLFALRLAKSSSQFRFLSTLLTRPPPPTNERIRAFLNRLRSNKIKKSAVNPNIRIKLLNLDSQIESYECELSELQSLTSKNPELAEIGQQDVLEIQRKISTLTKDAISLLHDSVIDSFPDECIMEIHAAAGGAEAALFAKDLLGMYRLLASRNKWFLEEVSLSMTDIGGCRSASLSVGGRGCYEFLRFEAGVHRVQRVPSTSSAGKIHTSTVTVAVLSVPKHVEVTLDPKELRIEAARATGAGGQYVNTTDSAVRVTHIPTGTTVRSEMRRSQFDNKKTALTMLQAKLYEMQYNAASEDRIRTRDSQVGYGDRSEKIRTYNFPDDRVTDHRIGVTVKGVETFLSGSLLSNFASKLDEVSKDICLDELLDSGLK